MRVLALALLLAQTVPAHVISMSSGWATLEGRTLDYKLQMPAYEVTHIQDPARAIFDHITFTGDSTKSHRTAQECHQDPASANYVCTARYEFANAPEKLGVVCTFPQITVTNHIHLLRATRGAKSDKAILDSSFPSATLAFRPPTLAETATRESGSGLLRVVTSAIQILLLIAIVLAARTRRELLFSSAAFVSGQVLGTFAILSANWLPNPRFTESAVALALAYLALEILAFPGSEGRWLLALVFGAFEGMYLALFINESGYSPAWVLAGAVTAAILILSSAAFARLGLTRIRSLAAWQVPLTKLMATALMITGAVWFAIRLRGE